MCVAAVNKTFWSLHVMLMDVVIVERNHYDWSLASQQHFQQNMQLVPTVVVRRTYVSRVYSTCGAF